MISYLSGTILAKKDGFIILEVNGVGFQVFLAKASFDSIAEQGSPLKLFCYLDFTERGLKLYGFTSFSQREVFELVRNIAGVGPKAALEISSLGSLEKIKQKIDKGEGFLKNIPNIGKKKAQKIVLELSGKLASPSVKGGKKKQDEFASDQAFQGLLNLGFSKEQAKEALSQLPKELKNPEARLKQALQLLGK